MKVEFYKTLTSAKVDSLLLKLNIPGYGRWVPYESAYDTLETRYAWRKNINNGKFIPSGWSDTTEVYIRGNMSNDTINTKGNYKEDTTIKRRKNNGTNNEQWLYDFLLSKNLRKPSVFEIGETLGNSIDYDFEHVFPFGENILKMIMLWKIIEGNQIITKDTVIITEKEIQLACLNLTLKQVHHMLISYFPLNIINCTLNKDSIRIKIVQPTYNLNGGPGFIKFDINGPNQIEMIENIMNYHKELIKNNI